MAGTRLTSDLTETMSRRLTLSRLIGAVCLGLAILARPAHAHEIPTRVALRGFIRPAGSTLRFLVRVPLEAMRDYDFPTFGEGYLDIAKAEPQLRQAAQQWVADYVRFFEGTAPLGPARLVAVRASLPLDLAFQTFERALAQTTGPPLPSETELPWKQAVLDILLEYPIQSPTADFSIDPELAHLGQRTTSVLYFLSPGSSERAFEYHGNPGPIRLDPRWQYAAWRFLVSGTKHILGGFDHLVFLVGLIIPFRRVGQLIPIVTAFTIAHSITLIAAALGAIPPVGWFPPLVETLIALSIVYLAIENALGASSSRRWMVAFGFGLVHGFGFSFALADTLQFAGRHLVTSLVAFNVGVEVGQLLVVALLVPTLGWLFSRVSERGLTIVLSLVVGHTAWHWMTDRGSALLQYQFSWAELGLEAGGGRKLVVVVGIIALAAWLLRLGFAKFINLTQEPSVTEPHKG